MTLAPETWSGLLEDERIQRGTHSALSIMPPRSADKRALARIQLLNGFADVRESVDEVMQAIQNVDSLA
jgi:hypothetical protein